MYLRRPIPKATLLTWNLYGFCSQRPVPQISIAQFKESLLSYVVTGFGAIDGGNNNRLVSAQVRQAPARAAVVGPTATRLDDR